MSDKKPMTLEEAVGAARPRAHARGRLPDGAEPKSTIMNVRAMPSQAAMWRQAANAARYPSANTFMCDAADLYASLLEALAPAALAAGADPLDYVRERLRDLTGHGTLT